MKQNSLYSTNTNDQTRKNSQISFDIKNANVNQKNNVEIKKNKMPKIKYYNYKEELPILFSYNELVLYVYKIFEKIKTHKSLVDSILTELSICHKQLFLAKKFRDKKTKYKHLVLAEASTNYLNVLMRNTRKLKLITPKNYSVWSYKIAEIDKSLQRWKRTCQK